MIARITNDGLRCCCCVCAGAGAGAVPVFVFVCRAHKGQRRVSNGDLKKRQQLSVCTISQEDVAALRGLFAGYMTQIRSGCKNIGQLQAR